MTRRTGPARVRAVEESRARPAPAVVIADGPEPLPQAAIDLLLEMLARGRAIEAELARIATAQDSLLAAVARGDLDQVVADAQVARLGERRRAVKSELAAAHAASRGIRPASSSEAVAEAIECIRLDAEDTPIEKRRALLIAVAVTIVIRPEMIGLDLRTAGRVDRLSTCSGVRVRQGLRVATCHLRAA